MVTTSKSENHQLIERWCERVWRDRDADAMEEMFEADGVVKGLDPDPLNGPAGLKAFHRAICNLMTDTSMELEQVVEQDDRLACLATFHGTCARTGNRVTTGGAMFFRCANGMIVEGINHFEFMAMFEQLDLLPPDSFRKALYGEAVATD